MMFLRMKEILKECRVVILLRAYIFNRKLEKYKREIQRRKEYSVFDYKNLAKDMPLVTKEYGYNAFYGLADIIKKLVGCDENIVLDAAIEHGIRPGNDLLKVDVQKDIIYTFGKRRALYLKKLYPSKSIYPIGPYIQYVKPILSEEETISLKTKYGRTLLVFHAHSTHHIDVDFNLLDFINKVETIKVEKQFDTVIVCMYWKDVLRAKDIDFLKYGYEICTAGHMFDPNFLLRLKSIISLADITMSNSLGTHICYSISAGKPHYLFYTELKEYHRIADPSHGEFDDQYYNEFINKALKCFGTYKERIEDEDIEFVKEYWGNWI